MLWTVDTVWKTAVQCGVGFPTWAWLSPAVWPGVLTTPLTGLSKDRNWPRPKLMANHVKLCIVETYVDPNILCITMGEIRMDSNRCVVSHWDAVWNKHSCLNLWICEKTLVSPDIMGMFCEPCGDLASLTRCVKSCGAYALQTSSRPIVWSPLETCVEVWCVGGPQCHPVMSWWPGLGWWLHTRHSREDSGSGSRLTGYPTATHHIQGQYCSVLTVCTQLLQFAYIISTAWIFCWAARVCSNSSFSNLHWVATQYQVLYSVECWPNYCWQSRIQPVLYWTVWTLAKVALLPCCTVSKELCTQINMVFNGVITSLTFVCHQGWPSFWKITIWMLTVYECVREFIPKKIYLLTLMILY